MNLALLNPGSLPDVLRKPMETIIGRANVIFRKEHNGADGTHTDITADSLAVDGNVLVGGSVVVAGAVTVTAAITSTTGSITAGANFYERGRAEAIGDWTDVTYSAGDFTASAGTWTVDSADVATFKYMRLGHSMWIQFVIANTDVSNAGVTLQIAIPAGAVASGVTRELIRIADAGAFAVGYALVADGATIIQCFATVAGGGFGITAADNTNVAGTILIEVQ